VAVTWNPRRCRARLHSCALTPHRVRRAAGSQTRRRVKHQSESDNWYPVIREPGLGLAVGQSQMSTGEIAMRGGREQAIDRRRCPRPAGLRRPPGLFDGPPPSLLTGGPREGPCPSAGCSAAVAAPGPAGRCSDLSSADSSTRVSSRTRPRRRLHEIRAAGVWPRLRSRCTQRCVDMTHEGQVIITKTKSTMATRAHSTERLGIWAGVDRSIPWGKSSRS
jgi:hypothetical protein